MKKTGLNGHVYNFSVDYTVTDTCHIIYIHKYLMKKYDKKKCLFNIYVKYFSIL